MKIRTIGEKTDLKIGMIVRVRHNMDLAYLCSFFHGDNFISSCGKTNFSETNKLEVVDIIEDRKQVLLKEIIDSANKQVKYLYANIDDLMTFISDINLKINENKETNTRLGNLEWVKNYKEPD